MPLGDSCAETLNIMNSLKTTIETANIKVRDIETLLKNSNAKSNVEPIENKTSIVEQSEVKICRTGRRKSPRLRRKRP